MDSLQKYEKGLVKNLTQKPNTIVEKLLAWYFDESGSVQLTAEEERLRERYEEIFTIYSKWGSYDQAVRMIMKMGDKKKGGQAGPSDPSAAPGMRSDDAGTPARKTSISRAQAYRDLKIATRIFGEVKKVSKEARRHILVEMGHRTWMLARKAKDYDAMTKAHKNLIMLEGFDQEDADLPDFENFVSHTYNIVVDPAAVGLPNLDKILEQAGVGSMDELMKRLAVRKQQKDVLNIDKFQDQNER